MKKIMLLCLLSLSFSVSAKGPYVNPAEDLQTLGPPDKLLFWTPQQQVAGYRNIDKVFPTRALSPAPKVLELPSSPRALGDVIVSTKSSSMTVDEYFVRQNAVGLLVLKDGQIAY